MYIILRFVLPILFYTISAIIMDMSLWKEVLVAVLIMTGFTFSGLASEMREKDLI